MTFLFRQLRQPSSQLPRAYRSVESYLAQLEPTVQGSLTVEQQREFERILRLAVPRPTPKLVDLRFEVDLLFSRFFIVLFVGEDRRQRVRRYAASPVTRLGNAIAVTLLLIGFNLAISATFLLVAYLTKSALNIDLLPGHLGGIAN